MKKLILTICLVSSFVTATETEQIQSSIDKAALYLLNNQAPDGGWGSAGRTKALNIYAPGIGAHMSFRSATTALCVIAIANLPESDKTNLALQRSVKYLLTIAPKIRRVNGRWICNNWSHAYIVRALLKVRKKKQFLVNRHKIDAVIKEQIIRLKNYSYVDGGWGYYDFKHQTNTPAGKPTSFTTATVLIALKEAQLAGFKLPSTVIKKALKQLRDQHKPDDTFIYSNDFRFYVNRDINKKTGSIARSQPALLALYLWEDKRVSVTNLDAITARLIRLNGWIDMGRKRPKPHESWMGIAGYFYYYGHYYGAEVLLHCKDNQHDKAESLAKLMIERQERNGSWFDFPLYDYGHSYGTAYALMSMQAYQKVLKKL